SALGMRECRGSRPYPEGAGSGLPRAEARAESLGCEASDYSLGEWRLQNGLDPSLETSGERIGSTRLRRLGRIPDRARRSTWTSQGHCVQILVESSPREA